MRLVLLKLSEAQPTRIPYRVGRQFVAARYGTTPAAVDGWPASDYLDAVAMLGVTGRG